MVIYGIKTDTGQYFTYPGDCTYEVNGKKEHTLSETVRLRPIYFRQANRDANDNWIADQKGNKIFKDMVINSVS